MNRNDKEFIVSKIRSEYTERNTTELDALRALDKKVKRPANILAYTVGSLSALIMGSGMSLVMTDIGNTLGIENGMVPGIVIGIFGMILAIINYPIFKGFLSKRKKKYSAEILSLSEKLMRG